MKNTLARLVIESLSSDGSGVGRLDGKAVFVPATAPDDEITVRIVKDMGRYAFGIVEELHRSGPGHIQPDCPVYRPCGGCCFRHLDYETEAYAKEGFVADAFRRLGGFEDLPVLPLLTGPLTDRYRNKVQFPVGYDPAGNVTAGFFAGRSHRLVPCQDCLLQPKALNDIAAAVCAFLQRKGIPLYNEASHKGLVRHIFLRQGWHSGQVLLCLVINGRSLPHGEEFCAEMTRQFPQIKTIVLNVNRQKTNVITGEECIPLFGPGFIEDTLCGVPVKLGPLSFYQVNTPAAEQLYAVAREFAALCPEDTLLDLYCGMGTIGLSMAEDCRALVGVEIVPEAVESARGNAAAMGVENARFLCADAGQAATQLAAEGLTPQVICLDPPRKGCDAATLDAVLTMAPRRVVMVSCNAATAARDCRYLADRGYRPVKVQPMDLFPRTKHVETVVLLSKGEVDSKKIRVEFSLEEMDMSEFQDGATYPQIKEYVLEHTGLKVSNLYISQIKRKCGIEVGKNYNLPKSEDSRQPQCPPEKEKAIREAFKYFGMI
ncbi:23S rRNA (uracil(1939)-C(5))-methyltransferase RlmD [Candidatus Allofournierella merdipullorum]|uniref:23S rRNA (uracil(1939)-C(5))-methyltransferase RlmD n=1 Tax=Candidatus Allofournierella merdipullorum TaxID=2838595 RepID=UPI003AB4EA34